MTEIPMVNKPNKTPDRLPPIRGFFAPQTLVGRCQPIEWPAGRLGCGRKKDNPSVTSKARDSSLYTREPLPQSATPTAPSEREPRGWRNISTDQPLTKMPALDVSAGDLLFALFHLCARRNPEGVSVAPVRRGLAHTKNPPVVS